MNIGGCSVITLILIIFNHWLHVVWWVKKVIWCMIKYILRAYRAEPERAEVLMFDAIHPYFEQAFQPILILSGLFNPKLVPSFGLQTFQKPHNLKLGRWIPIKTCSINDSPKYNIDLHLELFFHCRWHWHAKLLNAWVEHLGVDHQRCFMLSLSHVSYSLSLS